MGWFFIALLIIACYYLFVHENRKGEFNEHNNKGCFIGIG